MKIQVNGKIKILVLVAQVQIENSVSNLTSYSERKKECYRKDNILQFRDSIDPNLHLLEKLIGCFF